MKSSLRPLGYPALAVTLAAATAAAAAATGTDTRSTAEPAPAYAASGAAYGSHATTTAAGSGRSAYLTFHCTTRAYARHNATGRVRLPHLGTVGAVRTATSSRHPDAGTAEAVSTSRTAGISLLGGAVRARAVTVVGRAQHGVGFTTRGTTRFVGLQVAGKAVASSPAPNTVVRVPGTGTLTLNLQRRSAVGDGAAITVTALKLKVAARNPVPEARGTVVTVGHATAALVPDQEGLLRGAAYGSTATAAGNVTSGRTFNQPLDCQGTDGRDVTNRGTGIRLGQALRTGEVTSTVMGDNGSSTAITRSRIAGVSLLDGMVTASAVTAVAQASPAGPDASASRFTDLTVNGNRMPDTVDPNTRIDLGQLGTLWLNRVVTTRRGVAVHMLDLHLTKAYDGLRKGTHLTVGNALAGLRH